MLYNPINFWNFSTLECKVIFKFNFSPNNPHWNVN
nr:MAG TPA: hypothetical protein [Bacteriophage sp.]